MTLDSILVAVDFSPLSLAAVERACALAGERGLVRLLHVVNTELLPREVVHGRPADEIVAAARGLDLVVVGARARDASNRLFLGSVAEDVARRSAVPLARGQTFVANVHALVPTLPQIQCRVLA